MSSRYLAQSVVVVVLWSSLAGAEPIRVRLPEGNGRGFVAVRTLAGETIAYGEVIQRPVGELIQTHTVLTFEDGSVFDETAVFSQKDVFRLESYQVAQGGPSYPTSEISFDRKSGRYHARTQVEKGGKVKVASGKLEMPDDLYNGMQLTLVKNLPGGAGATVQLAVFTPEPRLIEMKWSWEGEDDVYLGSKRMRTMRSLVKLEIGGLAGAVASVVGKSPPDLRYWLVAGEIPAFVRFEGTMFLNGPVWRLEMTTVRWPK